VPGAKHPMGAVPGSAGRLWEVAIPNILAAPARTGTGQTPKSWTFCQLVYYFPRCFQRCGVNTCEASTD